MKSSLPPKNFADISFQFKNDKSFELGSPQVTFSSTSTSLFESICRNIEL